MITRAPQCPTADKDRGKKEEAKGPELKLKIKFCSALLRPRNSNLVLPVGSSETRI